MDSKPEIALDSSDRDVEVDVRLGHWPKKFAEICALLDWDSMGTSARAQVP